MLVLYIIISKKYYIDEKISDEVTPEVAFGCHLFTILLYNLTSITQNTREQRQHPWVSIYSAARDVIRYDKNLVNIFNRFLTIKTLNMSLKLSKNLKT